MNPAVLPRTDIRVRYPPSYVIEIFGGMAATQMYHNILQQCVSLSVCESQYRIETTETRHIKHSPLAQQRRNSIFLEHGTDIFSCTEK